MSAGLPQVPAGSGQHPVFMVLLSANAMDESQAFYASAFGWTFQALTPDIVTAVPPEGPAVTLRAAVPAGFQQSIPFIAVRDVEVAIEQILARGGSVEREPWDMFLVGKMARFRDPAGTIWGLMTVVAPDPLPHIPMPLGGNPRPVAGAVCSLEMYTADGGTVDAFFKECFGWSSLPTMPNYVAFDPGAGVGGVFQSHTPALPALVYLASDDVQATMAAVVRAGGEPQGEPVSMPGLGTFGYFKDPSGTTVGLIGP